MTSIQEHPEDEPRTDDDDVAIEDQGTSLTEPRADDEGGEAVDDPVPDA